MSKFLRLLAAAVFLFTTAAASAQQPSALPDAPSATLLAANDASAAAIESTSIAEDPQQVSQQTSTTPHPQDKKRTPSMIDTGELDANGNPIPIEHQQPHRILGFMPNFRSVSTGAVVHPPGWKYNFNVATHQAFDYSSFVFLAITSLSAEGMDSHPALGKGIHGAWEYSWRGFLDKTDGNYLAGWLLPSLLHEDTRYYAMGSRRSVPVRALYIMSRQVVTRTYGGSQTPNISGLGGKVLAQIISRTYYPTGTTSFSVLATKFAYSAMREMAITSIREFYPDIAAHYVKKHRQKLAAQAAAQATTATP